MDYILENLDDYKTATEEYEIRLNMWKKEISEREVEIENKLKELEIQRPLLTETLYNDFKEEIDFEKEQLELYRQKRFGPNGDWVAQEKILIQPIQDEVLAAVQLIAERNKFDYVYDKSSAIVTLYSEKKYDISELVLKSILRQEKLENLEIDFTDDLIQKRRDSLRKVNELKKESLQRKRDSILKARKNKIK
ncbi:MAG: OmpH family outer membrane protein [Flavobacteriaceae bacterium]|nr:OmpH family outer membrane protein [Flavobacteriaceae bacterium]MBL6680813.1 OmpH family outer membrane protein [Flavobacteriaceae bacterium]|tara:strand:- start:960 stop:1538 length:579 start_codon:yes stop_codon:yes gene_type:complete